MTKKKNYSSVSEMIHDLADDESFAKGMDAILESRQLVTALVAQRCARGISQSVVAEKMKRTQGSISKLESSNDFDIRLGDLISYAAAIGFEPHIVLHKSGMNLVDFVKFHAISMKRSLDRLAALSQNDESMSKAAFSFCGETVFNVLRFIGETASKLIPSKVESQPQFFVEVAGDESVGETCGAAS